MDKNFYKTVITFEVLHDVPLPDDVKLDELYHMTICGDASGHVMDWETTDILRDELIERCHEHGTDPNFFLGEFDVESPEYA